MSHAPAPPPPTPANLAYEELLDACHMITRHRQAQAYPILDRYVLNHVDVHTPNADLLAHIISESLYRRLDSTLIEGKNIYVQRFDIPQIVMFYKLAQAVPQIYIGHEVANQYLAKQLTHQREVTLLEIGIGRGVQLQRLLTRLMLDQTCRIERFHLIGVDPDQANLDDAGSAFSDLQKIMPFEIVYHPVKGLIEEMDLDTLRTFVRQGEGPLAINASFALHHTSHALGDRQARTLLLQRLAELRPRIFTLIEPSSDHDTERLARRFHNCWHHFSTVFDLIDESGLAPAERFSLKETFFGREIRDMFGASDRFRCERHETYESWLLRLTRAGFSPAEPIDVRFSLPSYCEAEVDDGLVRLGYAGTPIIAVFATTMR
ncbi:MAG: hypothetical protein H6741_29035 [Alphaproteobacteria bacterium]|nr:hypothetical protein [Alphaproteobacteria bacterium]